MEYKQNTLNLDIFNNLISSLFRLIVTKKHPRSKLRKRDLESIQRGTLSYKYRGVPCLKNPFDLAIYQLLINNLKPRTIIEIGSANGGSALWLSDLTKNLELKTKIISVDINPVVNLKIDNVQFLKGDIYTLEKSKLPEILENCDRPLLVIEDGPHTFEACLAALKFFHSYMRKGEYIVIEDGIVHELGLRNLADGPNRALRKFIDEHEHEVEVDRWLCDYFGQNFTWATNGYLKYT